MATQASPPPLGGGGHPCRTARFAAPHRARKGVDEVVCLLAPPDFYAVGQFYENFDQLEDEEVVRLLKELWGLKGTAQKPLTL